MEKPAIFAFTTSYHPFIGGAEIAIQEIAGRLADRFRFFIITARMRRQLPLREKRAEGTVIRVGLGSRFDKWLLLLVGPFVVLWEIQRLGRPHLKLLWGMDISFGTAVAVVVKMFSWRTPFVFTVQYGYSETRLARGRLGVIGLGFRVMLRVSDTLTAISTYLGDLARRYGYRGPAEVIHNGVALERFRPRPGQRVSGQAPVIITVSRLVFKNGVDTLIRAFERVRQSWPDARCHILGDGPERQSLEALARSLGVATAVTFFGNVPHADVPRYFARADLFVRPSRSEGMGNAFVEALAVGLPIIGTPVGGITDIIRDGETGLFTIVDDPADLAKKILRLLTDQTLAAMIVANGRKMVEEHFSWAVISHAFRILFRRHLWPQERILITSPQFAPDIGGPGSYARNLTQRLSRRGHAIAVLCYGAGGSVQLPDGTSVRRVSRRIPSGLKHFIFFIRAWQLARRSDVVLVLDPVIVGAPVALACWLSSKNFLLRVEGDFLWEWYVERTGRELTLRQFYERFAEQKLSCKEWLMWRMAWWVFLQARRIVFSSSWRREIYKIGYPVREECVAIIKSPWPKPQPARGARERLFIFAGRFIRIKNLSRLIRAFLAASPPQWRLELIGDGPERLEIERLISQAGARPRVSIKPSLAQGELLKRIASAHALLLPSLSDVSPNVILDCITTATPFLLTRESGFYETAKDVGVFVDPRDEEDIKDKLRLLLDPKFYAEYQLRLQNFGRVHSWTEVAREWLKLIRSAL